MSIVYSEIQEQFDTSVSYCLDVISEAIAIFDIALLSRDLLLDFPAVCSVSSLSIVRLRISDKAFGCGVC